MEGEDGLLIQEISMGRECTTAVERDEDETETEQSKAVPDCAGTAL